jgi:hypothetical protein
MARPKGAFPKTWKYKDPILHAKHVAYLRQKAQANFRQEGWEITIEEFFEMWPDDLWVQRGRSQSSYCMIRKNITQPWSKSNCVIMLRYQQLVRNKKPGIHPHLGFPKDL